MPEWVNFSQIMGTSSPQKRQRRHSCFNVLVYISKMSRLPQGQLLFIFATVHRSYFMDSLHGSQVLGETEHYNVIPLAIRFFCFPGLLLFIADCRVFQFGFGFEFIGLHFGVRHSQPRLAQTRYVAQGGLQCLLPLPLAPERWGPSEAVPRRLVAGVLLSVGHWFCRGFIYCAHSLNSFFCQPHSSLNNPDRFRDLKKKKRKKLTWSLLDCVSGKFYPLLSAAYSELKGQSEVKAWGLLRSSLSIHPQAHAWLCSVSSAILPPDPTRISTSSLLPLKTVGSICSLLSLVPSPRNMWLMYFQFFQQKLLRRLPAAALKRLLDRSIRSEPGIIPLGAATLAFYDQLFNDIYNLVCNWLCPSIILLTRV